MRGARARGGSTAYRSSTSPRSSAGSPRRRPTAARRSSTSAAGNPEVGPPAARRRGAEGGGRPAGRPRLRALPRAARRCATRSRAGTAPSTASRSTRSARSPSSPAAKQALLELALVLGEGGRTILLPDPYYPDYPSGIALAGAELGLVPLDPAAGWQPDLEGLQPAAALYLNFPSNPCAVCAHPGVFEAAVRLRGPHRHRDRPRRRVRRPRLRRAHARELPRDPRGEGRGRRALDDVQDLRNGRLADRVRARECRDRRTPQRDRRPLARRASSRRSSTPRSPRSRGRRRASRSAAPPTSAGAIASRRRSPSRPSARAPSTSGCGSRRASRRSGCSPSTASRSPRARGSGRAGPGGRACRSRSRTRSSTRGSSASHRCSRRPTREGRDRRPVLLVVLGRCRRARREPGRLAQGPRPRCVDPDGPRPARDTPRASSTHAAGATETSRRGSSRSAARSSCPRTDRSRTSSSRRGRSEGSARRSHGSASTSSTCTSR